MANFAAFFVRISIIMSIFASYNKYFKIMLNSILLLFGNLGTTELIIIVVIILLLFGGKKIPELMKGMGKGVKSFKEGMEEMKEEIEKPLEDDAKKAEEKDSETKSNGK